MAWSFTVGKCANSLGALIFICHEQIVKAFMSKSLKEPFTIGICLNIYILKSSGSMVNLTCRGLAALSMH